MEALFSTRINQSHDIKALAACDVTHTDSYPLVTGATTHSYTSTRGRAWYMSSCPLQPRQAGTCVPILKCIA
jgi:hypothetical protein